MEGVGVRVGLDGVGGRDEGLLAGGLIDVDVVPHERRDADARLVVGWDGARIRPTEPKHIDLAVMSVGVCMTDAPGGSGRPGL